MKGKIIQISVPRIYVERRIYYGQCERCPRRFVSLHRGRIKGGLCGVCRREAARIPPGQEQMFIGVSV